MSETTAGLLVLGIGIVIWLAPIPVAAWMFRRKGYSPHWAWFGILPLACVAGGLVLCVAILLPGRTPETRASVTARQPPFAWRLPPWLVVLFATLICAFLGGVSSVFGTFSNAGSALSAIIGGCIGLLLGLAVWFDNRAVQGRKEEMERSAALAPEAGVQPASVTDRPSDAVAAIMLVLPFVAGILVWQHEAVHLTTYAVYLLVAATVVCTALLGYYDMRLLVVCPRSVPPPGSPLFSRPMDAFVGILVFWALGYPLYFFARRRFGATNLIVPALVATAVFLAPTVGAWFFGPALPSVGSPDVLALVAKIIEDSPVYQARKDEFGKLRVREPVEISFDQHAQRRVGRAKLVSKLGEEEIFYTIQWQDREKGMFAIQVYDQQP
ncbi:hypothetical protein ACFL5Q_05390 [Planctomycetota bacterium]